MVVGLAFAVLSGIPAGFFGEPYLTALWGGSLTLPAVGKVMLGTPLIFDIGVYLVVAGVVMMLYQTMERWQVAYRMNPNSTTSS
jgi:multicomponent Na+:H+ antiporter subunit B